MSEPTRAYDNPRRKGEAPESHNEPAIDLGQIAVIALVALAAVSSVIMLLTGSNWALKLALIASLWAAGIGFFLVYRYRQQAKQSEAKAIRAERDARALRTAAAERGRQLEPHGEQMAHFEHTAAVIAELRDEIAALRAQIEELSGQAFGYEPVALKAEARRVREIESQEARLKEAERVRAEQAEQEAREQAERRRLDEQRRAEEQQRLEQQRRAEEARLERERQEEKRRAAELEEARRREEERREAARAEAARREKERREAERQQTERNRSTATVWRSEPTVTHSRAAHRASESSSDTSGGGHHSGGRRRKSGAPSADAVAGRLGRQDYRSDLTNPLSALITENSTKKAEESSPSERQETHQSSLADRGRRRRDENDKAVSVAELLANMKKDRS